MLFMCGLWVVGVIDAAAEQASSLESQNQGQVKWRPWSKSAFDAAREQNRLILLSIAATWSHTSRRMDAATYADPKLAALINQHFVPIQVDRDRRPDIDLRYQEAIQATTGGGGWPLTVVLTPEGRVITGGTYFGIRDDWVAECPGLPEVLSKTVIAWREGGEALLKQAQELDTQLGETGIAEGAGGAVPADVFEQTVLGMRRLVDPRYGGFQGKLEGARFPAPVALDLALLQFHRSDDERSLALATVTMNAMLRGGFHDRIGGGFHRFATDRRWRTPRFEKLLSVNAEMLIALVQLWQETGKEAYEGAAKGLLRWVDETLADREKGGFYASQASGTGVRDDGNYYTWSIEDIELAIGDDALCDFVKARYGIEAWGELPETAPHRNVLYEVEEGAEARDGARVEQALAFLRTARAQRPAAPVDRGLPVDANARMISAYLLAADAFDHAAWRLFALKSLERLWRDAVDQTRGVAHWIEPNGEASYLGWLCDEAALALALQDGYLASGADEERYLVAARASLLRLEERFADAEAGCFCDLERGKPALGRLQAKRFPYQDSPAPSGNALAAMAFARMAELTGEAAYAERGRKALGAFGQALVSLGPVGAGLVLASDAAQNGCVVIAVHGDSRNPETRNLLRAVQRSYAPHKLVTVVKPGDRSPLRRLGFEVDEGEAGPVVYIRAGKKFLGAVRDARKVPVLLEVSGRP